MLWTVHASRNPIVLYVVFNRVCVGSDGTLGSHGLHGDGPLCRLHCVRQVSTLNILLILHQDHHDHHHNRHHTPLRLPSLKVSTLLLSGLLLYDVFWVFFSQYVFSANVMVKVVSTKNSDQFEIKVIFN